MDLQSHKPSEHEVQAYYFEQPLFQKILQLDDHDYDLDPELEQEDFNNIISTAKEKEVDYFIFEISEDGIEVSF